MENIDIDIYCDEVKETSVIGPTGENESWIYIGFLIIPRSQKVIIFNELMKCRCKSKNNWQECTQNCSYHVKNGKEIHYQEVNSADIYHIANRWVDYFLDSTSICFYSIGINISRLNLTFFGDVKGSERYSRIYNRFFRTAIQKSTKSFYHNAENITIWNVYHDIADVSEHQYFPWHTIYKLEKNDDKITFKTKEIEFIDSDHRISKNKNSHFIQLTDILLGLFYNSFHFTNTKRYGRELTEMISPMLEDIITKPWDRQSRYHYVHRVDFDFFPKNKISNESSKYDTLRANAFYKNREIIVNQRNQISLF